MPAQSPLVEKRSRLTNGNQHSSVYTHFPTPILSRTQLDPIPAKSLAKVTVASRSSRSPRSPRDKEAKELKKLLALLNTVPSPDQTSSDVDETERGVSRGSTTPQWPSPQPTRPLKQQSAESQALEQFSTRYQTERDFSKHTHAKTLSAVFTAIIKHRLQNSTWSELAPPENILRVLQCLRILMRDAAYQKEFIALGSVAILAEHLHKATSSYLMFGDSPFLVEILIQMTNVFQKLSAQVTQREKLIGHGVHRSLVLLLSANEVVVLHCSLHALIGLAQSPEPRSQIAQLNSVEILLRIIQDYDIMSKKLAANLLRLLCGDYQAKEMIKIYDGIPILLSVLQSDGIKLLIYTVWCLVQLSEDKDVSNEIRQRGGIPLLLALLGDRRLVSDKTAASGYSSLALKSPAVLEESEEIKEHQLNLKSACCACLTELVLNDTNAQQIVQCNGIYSMGQLILPQEGAGREVKAVHNLQANAFRTLRFLFSVERNRKLFKRLFPPDMFEKFIDIGVYNKNIAAYKCLVERINSFNEDALAEIIENLASTNQNKEPARYIGDYAVLELLGSGAYGSVYKVRKTAGQSYLAMKEINTGSSLWGSTIKERATSVGNVVNELSIIKEQLKHPNVVKYYKTFIDQERLYIVMELIEGAPLEEHFRSLKEKKEKFPEDRVWKIFIQCILALRYLHKEKKILHRDLSPNNIMLGEGDKVTITDFGLAKVKQADSSKMLSRVGTILYSCPELIQNKPYGEKADVWAIGCILYQMCTLNPPFSTNLLSLALKIVEAKYDPINPDIYSEKIISTVRLCITPDPEKRPDIVGVAGHIADILMEHMDTVNKAHSQMEKKLEHEKRKTKKHFDETSRTMQQYHQLQMVPMERCDKIVNLASSGGGSSMKDESDVGESVLSDNEGGGPKSRTVSSSGQTTDCEESTTINNGENGWCTDDDPEYSSSSDCQSRESSAGHGSRSDPVMGRSQATHAPSASAAGPQGNTGWAGPHQAEGAVSALRMRPKGVDYFDQLLSLEIPSAKYSRDSGISSGDPSPNNSSPPVGSVGMDTEGERARRPRSFNVGQSSSSPTFDSIGRRAVRVRPTSATTPTLTISQRKVREINDPILQMLHQLHKIIYITQLPPTLSHHARRRIVERYKRALFEPMSTSSNLKNELRKLLTGSHEVIDLNLGPLEALQTPSTSRQPSAERERKTTSDRSTKSDPLMYDLEACSDLGVTYEQMQNIIERVLVESGYYDLSPQVGQRTVPMPPVRSFSTPYGGKS